jgi:hypothetical protein
MSDNAGRRGRRYERLKANLRAQQRQPCILCGQRIDYSLRWPDPASFSVQHIQSWIDHPELREDPANLAQAHLDCNQGAGTTGGASVDLGSTSHNW